MFVWLGWTGAELDAWKMDVTGFCWVDPNSPPTWVWDCPPKSEVDGCVVEEKLKLLDGAVVEVEVPNSDVPLEALLDWN